MCNEWAKRLSVLRGAERLSAGGEAAGGSSPIRFDGRPAVKDLIEALGVPHTEVDLILANGESVDFAYGVRDGDRISVYPVFESLDIGPVVRVRPEPLRETRFVCDTHLGRLAAYLRMLGFDTLLRARMGLTRELATIRRPGRRPPRNLADAGRGAAEAQRGHARVLGARKRSPRAAP